MSVQYDVEYALLPLEDGFATRIDGPTLCVLFPIPSTARAEPYSEQAIPS